MDVQKFLKRLAELWQLAVRPPASVRIRPPKLKSPPALLNPPSPPATTKAQVDAYLNILSAEIRASGPAPVPSVIVTGAMRCGKTLVAREICAHAGMINIPSDRIRNATYDETDGAQRARLIKYVYKKLLLTHPTGLVIEGTVFLDRGVTLPIWARTRGTKVFAIGYALDDAKRKARSMINYRKANDCWTNGVRNNQEMQSMARRIVLRSKDIRAYCAQHGLVYLDLDSGRFNVELRRVTRVVLRKMRVIAPTAR